MDQTDTQLGDRDPAVHSVLRKQDELLSHHNHALRSLLETTQQLAIQVNQLTTQVAGLAVAPLSSGAQAPAPASYYNAG